ncbi:MAG: hypothetical protein CVV07_03065 [Gammaproteobacteria bacterium HGW-Gammaproteobacteria-11]|nr:MAG: hypothetical protein CVV07_03065 [Gammaproteobacteria bacterium HGW-Gammaproteobacteria-11]
MSESPTAALIALLDQVQPDTLLCVSQGPVPALSHWCTEHPETLLVHVKETPLTPEVTARRYDLAVVADQLEHMDKRPGVELLAGLRNLTVSRMAVLVDLQRAADWQDTDFFGLAMQRQARFERDAGSLTLFSYDLAAYKNVPDWLNAKYWANPEMYDKYWW